jgi:hypothetical protein
LLNDLFFYNIAISLGAIVTLTDCK